MESRFNIPAPALVKAGRDACSESGSRLKVTVPQGDAEATAKVDLAKDVPRKASSCSLSRPYRKPTQVGGHKCAKARE